MIDYRRNRTRTIAAVRIPSIIKMSGNRDIPTNKASSSSHPHDFASSLARSFQSGSPLAQEALRLDLADDDDVENQVFDEAASEADSLGPTLYRRPSGVAFGASRPVATSRAFDGPILTRDERQQSKVAELSLMRDNHLLPPKHPLPEQESVFRRLYKHLFSTKVKREAGDEEGGDARRASETSPLLRQPTHEQLNEQWEAAVAAGQIKTTWQREAMTIAVYSRSLIITFLLQYSINIASIFAVGHIGKIELGAVSRKYRRHLSFVQSIGLTFPKWLP